MQAHVASHEVLQSDLQRHRGTEGSGVLRDLGLKDNMLFEDCSYWDSKV